MAWILSRSLPSCEKHTSHRPVEQDGYMLYPNVIRELIVTKTTSINNTEMPFIIFTLLTSSLTIENLFW